MNIFKRPMLYAAVLCSAVAVISLYEKTLAYLIVVASILLFGIAVYFKKYKYITVAFAVILFTINLGYQLSEIGDVNKFDSQNASGEFLVISEPEIQDGFTMVTLRATECDTLPKNTKCLVFDYKMTKLKMGDIVDANIKVSGIDQFDKYRLSNYSNGIYTTANATKITQTGERNLFYQTAGKIRKYVKNTINSSFKGDTAGLLLALTTGERTLISDRFLNNVKTTGISHVIVVSGMHLSIIMVAVFWCFDRFFYNKYVRSALSIAFVIFIFAVCGFTMSITRAGAMFIIAGLSPIFNRDSDSLNSLLTAVVVVLIGSPFAIFNISFQLSLLSTIAIIWVAPFYYRCIIKRLNISSRILKTILNISLCSIFSMIFTLPVTIETFGFVSVVSPITNLLITYLVTVVLVMNIMSLAFGALPIINFLSYALFYIVRLCSDFIVYIVNTIANLPITVAVLPKGSFWWSIMLVALVIGYMYFHEFRRKRSDLNANCI